MSEPAAVASESAVLQPRLGLWDTISLIVGIVIGSAVFVVPGSVAGLTQDPMLSLVAWFLGGLLAVIGAACYAELATSHPGSGGDFIYLSCAFGPLFGFLFGWVHLSGVLTGSIGALSYVVGEHAARLTGNSLHIVPVAAAAVIAITGINLLGVVTGKRTQNMLTTVKIVGLLAIVLAGFTANSAAREDFFGRFPALLPLSDASAETQSEALPQTRTGSSADESPSSGPPVLFGIAMVLVMYAYGGWNDAAFVAAEVRHPQRNLPRALMGGMGLITLIYLLLNMAFFCGLGEQNLQKTQTPAADLLQTALGTAGRNGMACLVILSALGSMNGLVLTGSRVHARLGESHRWFRRMARWETRRQAPQLAIVVQAIVALAMILAVGTERGQHLINELLAALGQPPPNWNKYDGGFNTLVAATAPVFWLFFLMTGHALFVLRAQRSAEPAAHSQQGHLGDVQPSADKAAAPRQRSFRVPGYPLTPMVFCGVCTWMLFRSVEWAGGLTWLSIAVLCVGALVYRLGRTK